MVQIVVELVSIVSSGRLVVDGIVIDVENRPWPRADVWCTSMNQVAMDVCHPFRFPDDRFNSMVFCKIRNLILVNFHHRVTRRSFIGFDFVGHPDMVGPRDEQ